MGGMAVDTGVFLRKEESSFSEEKEAKRLFSVGRSPFGWVAATNG
jgi:hypothetical protein